MFKSEQDSAKIGRYLSDLIDQKYESKRKFCRAYLEAAKKEPNNENLTNMANRLSQIIKGNKAIQIYDLPYFTDGDFGTIYRSFKFNADDDCMAGDDAGNNLIEETDARGYKTTYTVDGDTSRNKEYS